MGARRELLSLTLLLALAGCDRSGSVDECRAASKLSTPGASAGLCPESVFEIKDTTYRHLTGKLYAGENVVPDAIVRMEPSAGWRGDLATSATVTTDLGGAYAMRVEAPLHYDLTTVVGGSVLAARSLRFRYFEPTVDVPFPAFSQGAPFDLSAKVDTAFRSHLDVIVETPLAGGQKLAFFAAGANAISVHGDVEQGLTLVGTSFQTAATIYAVAYDGAGDLATATSFARADVQATSGQKELVRLAFAPITRSQDITLDAKLPTGFAVSSVDLIVSFSRTSRGYLTTLVPGVKKRVPNFVDVEGEYIAYRVLARAEDGRQLDSGIVGFAGPSNEGDVPLTADLSTLAAPVQLAPITNTVIGVEATLEASGTGTLEHTLTPDGGTGPTLHIITAPGTTSLPSFAALGVVPPTGAYVWTIKAYPRSTTTEQLGGRDGRRYQPTVSAPARSIVFR